MNTKLVNSVVQLINSLSQEEQEIIRKEISQKKNDQKTLEQIKEHRKAIHSRRGGKPFDPSIDDIFAEMREERSQELLRACSPDQEER